MGRCALASDPAALYDRMKAQYDKGAAGGWKFGDWIDYFSTILDAGRAYSLRRPDDPNAQEVAGVAIDVATKLRYDPLSNRDASEWYLREAATKIVSAADPQRGPAARDLLARLDRIEQTPSALARAADADATANVLEFQGDPEAMLAQLQTTWKAWLLTQDAAYRSLALARAAQPAFPLAKLSDPTAEELLATARGAAEGGAGYTADDRANGKAIVQRRIQIRDPREIARVEAASHARLLSIRAPADEYFGRMQMSVPGMRNEIFRINQWLDAGWGERMSDAGTYLADAIDAWHKAYPQDTGIPDALLRSHRALERIGTDAAHEAAGRMRRILLLEYTDSLQARELLSAAT